MSSRPIKTWSIALPRRPHASLTVHLCGDGIIEILMSLTNSDRRLALDIDEAAALASALYDAVIDMPSDPARSGAGDPATQNVDTRQTRTVETRSVTDEHTPPVGCCQCEGCVSAFSRGIADAVSRSLLTIADEIGRERLSGGESALLLALLAWLEDPKVNAVTRVLDAARDAGYRQAHNDRTAAIVRRLKGIK